MDLMRLAEQARDTTAVNRVFGEPVTRDGVTVIPVAKIAGGGGGGWGAGRQTGTRPGNDTGNDTGEGGGGGFGLGAAPAGVFVIKDGDVRWQPALDVNRIVLGAQIVGVVLLLTIRTVTRLLTRRRTRR
ncbi:spore germination protein GerW family protein [Planomonospora sp. ID82291]|uniref:spore germination protein GerW family protein n=1 Tax=Planomonospora sp. ID82291 TaxID=2738136 RepID=UPI0018C3DA16|nr:spore germination protein GerW family protein [Planomonospora sp. ID82291]MBG0816538.1 sporulation protein [Planomonospora sp. ID82291]